MENDKIGLNFRSLLDGLLNQRERDLTDYKQRNELISEIEDRIKENDWIQLSNGAVFDKTSPKQFKITYASEEHSHSEVKYYHVEASSKQSAIDKFKEIHGNLLIWSVWERIDNRWFKVNLKTNQK